MEVGMGENWPASWSVAALDTKIDYVYIGTEQFHCFEYRQEFDLFV
jgi:glucose dehydrogenase